MTIVEELDEQRANVARAAAITAVEAQLSTLLAQMHASIRDAATEIHPALQPFGLKLLRLLARRGPMHAGGAAEALMVDKSTISRQVRALEDLKLLELQPDPTDGRCRILALTDFGAEELGRAQLKDKALVHSRLDSWSPEDLEQLAALLGRLNRSVL